MSVCNIINENFIFIGDNLTQKIKHSLDKYSGNSQLRIR